MALYPVSGKRKEKAKKKRKTNKHHSRKRHASERSSETTSSSSSSIEDSPRAVKYTVDRFFRKRTKAGKNAKRARTPSGQLVEFASEVV
ncbi:hypothetical protein D918_00049 [Trichuris suis]|nr:hypothetical protein D918_00049 [Trichuris suis]